MTWSYSAQRTFARCQRQWYYSNFAAQPRVTDPMRRRALYYKQLNTINAWRGRLVDTVISAHVVPSLNDVEPLDLEAGLIIARRLFDQQKCYAESHRAATTNVTISKEGGEFALLFENEFQSPPSDADFQRAWTEVATSLRNFWKSEALWTVMEEATDLIPQPRSIHFALADGTKGVAFPDLIAFFEDKPPTIIDWKVHADAGNNARRQLAVYALALSKCSKAHFDFPPDWKRPATEISLIEAQLLLDRLTYYQLDEEDVADVETFIASSAYEMECLAAGKKYADLDLSDFRTAHDGTACDACAFQTLCMEAVH